MTVAEKLFELGFRKTAWKDLTTGEETFGTLDPSKSSPARYGAPPQIKGWPERNLVGGHASGENTHLFDAGGTRFLAPEILGVSPSSMDVEDVSYIDGAAQHLLEKGRELGIIVDERVKPTGPGPKPPKPEPVEAKPDFPDLRPVVKEIRERGDKLEAKLPKTGGKPIQDLVKEVRAYLATVDRLTAKVEQE
jgi:hypothetical protein